MDTLENELKELKGFIADLKADRQAQKEKEKRESWTKYTSLSIVFIAVLAAIATQWAGRYSSRTLVELNNSTFNQAQTSDAWSLYQASSIKQNMYEILPDMLPADRAAGSPDAAKRAEAFKAKLDKYNAAKEKSSAEAKGLEKMRDEARAAATEYSKRGSAMGLAVSIFQISIALGSICLVTKKKPLWFFALILAVLATGQMVLVWLL